MAKAVTVSAAAPSPTPYSAAKRGSNGSHTRSAAAEPQAPKDSATMGRTGTRVADSVAAGTLGDGNLVTRQACAGGGTDSRTNVSCAPADNSASSARSDSVNARLCWLIVAPAVKRKVYVQFTPCFRAENRMAAWRHGRPNAGRSQFAVCVT